ncbi:MAG: polyprenol monophosphomannose synthase [Acidimicrobiia bacterium]|nr:polyprenol monophosphomannose synthase [Acidimicrobiia bacterium]
MVVLPTYNEIENIRSIVSKLTESGYAVLIVDDASPDGTGDAADELAAANSAVSVLHRSEKAGLGPAYAAGFRQALDGPSDIVCQMDADFSHDPADVPRLVAAVQAGADVAIGSRYVAGGGVAGWPIHRRWLSRWGNRYAQAALGSPVRDMTAGFRAFRREALGTLEPATCKASGYGFQVEMAWRASREGLAIEEVPIVFTDRRWGTSKMTPGIAAEAMLLVSRWGSRRLLAKLPWPSRSAAQADEETQ